jgi:hypothetical protein
MSNNVTVTSDERTATFSRTALLEAQYNDDLRIVIIELLAAQWSYRFVDALSTTEQIETIFKDIEAQLQL